MQAASPAIARPARRGGASGGILSSASDDDGAGFTARCASSQKHNRHLVTSAYVRSKYSIFGVAGKELFQHFPERGSYVQLGEDGQPA
jgi:hypothetical protein